MNTNTYVAVKVTKLAGCHKGGEVTLCNWGEFYCPTYESPICTEGSATKQWAQEKDDRIILVPSVGEHDWWVNEDLCFLADRFTCSVDDYDDSRLYNEFSSAVRDTLADGEVRTFTLIGADGSFCTFRTEAFEKLPPFVPFVTPSTKPTADALCDICEEIPAAVSVEFANSVRAVNGEPLEEVPPMPRRTFAFRVTATAVADIEVTAATKEEALALAEQKCEELEWASFSEDGARHITSI